MAEAGGDDKNTDIIVDTELDALLEEALLDYDKPSKPLSKPVIPENSDTPTQDFNSALPPGMDLMGDAFDPSHLGELNSLMEGVLGKDLMEEYQSFSKELEENLPDMFNLQGLENDLFSPFNQTETEPRSKPVNKARSSQTNKPHSSSANSTDETIEDLHKNLEFAKTAQPPELQKEGENIIGMVKELMGDLLSREVLYGPLKDLCKQYPQFLDGSKDISGEDRNRYTRQYIIIQEVCKEYESESETDSQETRMRREEKILLLIQELQSLGSPPQGVIEEPSIPNFSQLFDSKNSCGQQ